MNPEKKQELVLRCQMVLDFKNGRQFLAEQLANLIEAEILADREERK